jgi:diguanylate cyclase (GGDEF)-like protein
MGFSLKLRFFLSSLLIGGLVVWYAASTLEEQKASGGMLRDTLAQSVSAMRLASGIKHDFVFYDDLVFRFLSTGDRSLLAESERARARARAAMAGLDRASDSPAIKEALAQLRDESAVYFRGARELIEAAPTGVVPEEKATFFKLFSWAKQIPEQQKTLGTLSARGQIRLSRIYGLCDTLQELSRMRLEEAQKRVAESLARGERDVRWGGSAVVGGIVLVAALLALSVLVPLGKLRKGIQRIMAGNLDFEIPPSGPDEIGEITQAFNAMTRRVREKQEQLVRESITDALTGVHNFRYFQQELKVELDRARRYARPLSLVIVDVDHFKAYNDKHGHEAGNGALRGVTEALGTALRSTDRLARYGGEEFAVLLPETDEAQAREAAERFRQAVGKRRVVTVSVGGATFPLQAKEADELVESADQALYRAKKAGRDRVEWARA